MLKLKPETKAKWEMRARKAKDVAKSWFWPVLIGGTFGAAWGGYKMGIHNSREIKDLRDRYERTVQIVDNNAECSRFDRKRIEELERQQNLLFEKALEQTEGKAS